MTTRVLLWSPLGAGEHYYGPGAFAHRLYGSASPGAVNVELVHSTPAQAPTAVFAQNHRLDPQPDSALHLATYLWRSRRWLKRNAKRFDVFHGMNGFHPTVAPAASAIDFGLPSVIFVAGHKIEFTDKGGLRGLLGLARTRRKMARRVSALIAMSRAIHQELLEIGIESRRIARIPMGIDMRRFSPVDPAQKRVLQDQLGLQAGVPTLTFVGAVTPRKRPHLIVEAMGLLRQQSVDCQLVLAGPTPLADYAAEMRSRAQALNVKSDVHWLGHTTAIERVLQASDVFLLPSSSEGMPAALVEAMACGSPAIVTRISGCEDLVIEDVNGYFVMPSAEEIADRIKHYALNPALARQHGERARRDIAALCSNEIVMAAHLQLFEAVKQGRDPEAASILRF